MFKKIRKSKWYKKLIRKLYEDAYPYRIPTKWDLSCNGYSITIYDMSYFGEFEQIRICADNDYEGRVYNFVNENGRRLTIDYIMNDYNHLPDKMKVRMREIFKRLDVYTDKMDELKEEVDEFFGTEEL